MELALKEEPEESAIFGLEEAVQQSSPYSCNEEEQESSDVKEEEEEEEESTAYDPQSTGQWTARWTPLQTGLSDSDPTDLSSEPRPDLSLDQEHARPSLDLHLSLYTPNFDQNCVRPGLDLNPFRPGLDLNPIRPGGLDLKLPPALFSCPLCQQGCPTRPKLTEHLTGHVSGNPMHCLICGTRLQNQGDLRRHMMTHSGEKPFFCEKCGKLFSRRHALQKHQLKCLKRNCQGGDDAEEGSFTCSVCAMDLPTRSLLSIHMVVHVSGDPPQCQVCAQPVKTNSNNVLRHMMLHTGEKPFTCKTCGKSFSRKFTLRQHLQVCEETQEMLKIARAEAATFRCSLCAQAFDTPTLLTDHMTNHVIISETAGTCLVCHKAIQRSKNDVRRHMMIHSGEKPFSCQGCGKSFNRNSTLQVHVQICSSAVPVVKASPEKVPEEEDDEEGTFGCSLCEKAFFRKGLLTDHLTTHLSEPPGTCLICCKNIGTKRNDVRRHMMIHSGEKPFSCNNCGMKFNRKFTLRHHNKLCTQGDPQGAPQSEEAPAEAAVEAPEEVSVVKVKQEEREEGEEPEAETTATTRCKFCNETFYEPSLLTEHMARHTDDVTGACLICGKGLGRTSAEIRQHMMVHSGEKPFSCKVCGRRFIRTLALKTHMKTHEQSAEEASASKPLHVCSVCGQGFKTMTVLKYHMFIHSGVRPFSCSVCGRRFRQQGDVRRHMMLHDGVKPFVCRVCDRGFARRNALRLHLRTHIAGGVVDEALLEEAPEGGECDLSPVIICDSCGQGFMRSLHFQRHLSTCKELNQRSQDRPFSCSLCAEPFTERLELIDHVRTHKDGEYVSCAICNKSLRRGDLKAHLALHAGEKRHVCPVCGKGFSRNTHLRGHLRTHTKQQPAPGVPSVPSAPGVTPEPLSASPRPHDSADPSADPAPAQQEALVCHFCGKTYTKKTSLTSHIAENHKQPLSFKCPVCGKFLRRKNDLKRHLRIHSDDKPYQCSLCSKDFSRSDRLRAHVKAHHAEDGLLSAAAQAVESGPALGAELSPQSHTCPDCLFPCSSYISPESGERQIHCPSCQSSFDL